MARKSKDGEEQAVEQPAEEKVEKPEESVDNVEVKEETTPEKETPEDDKEDAAKKDEVVAEKEKEDKPSKAGASKKEKTVDVPEGYALVPLEPTNQMIAQGYRFGNIQSRAIYKVMVEQYLKDQEKESK